MVSFFPTPYPDEILYSILARYHVRSGNLSSKTILYDLFGSTTIVATVDLPSHINALIRNLPPLAKYTADSVIRQYTLYPFYAPFLFSQTAQIVLNSMKEHSWGDIHARAGIMASAVGTPSRLRFCPRCLHEDEEECGESYWHRLHQVTGVLVCPKHFCLLQDSKVVTPGENRHEFYPASRENCVASLQALKLSENTFTELIGLARDIEWILSACLPGRSDSWYQQQYISLLIDKGLATATGRVRQVEFFNRFTSHFSDELLNLLNSTVSSEGDHNWLSGIVRKHRKAFHPVRHLLLMRFLREPAPAFFGNEHDYKPFGDGPWRCFNGAAKHYLQPVITGVEISWSHDMKKAVGTFSCSCGFVYSSSNPNQLSGSNVSFGKIKAFGRIWEKRLKELVKGRRLGLREVARRLKVDSRTIKRYVKRLGFTCRWQTPSSLQHEVQLTAARHTKNKARDKHRKIWASLQQKKGELSKSTLRRQAPGTYNWLYRNDRLWLNHHSPMRKAALPAKHRVDWNRRDKDVLNLVKNAVQNILALTPPVRLTLSKVGKTTGHLSLLEKHLNKLPLTNSFLKSVVESIEDFQIRRAHRAISILIKQNEFVKTWQVLRLAGIGKTRSPRVDEFITHEARQANLRERKKVG